MEIQIVTITKNQNKQTYFTKNAKQKSNKQSIPKNKKPIEILMLKKEKKTMTRKQKSHNNNKTRNEKNKKRW